MCLSIGSRWFPFFHPVHSLWLFSSVHFSFSVTRWVLSLFPLAYALCPHALLTMRFAVCLPMVSPPTWIRRGCPYPSCVRLLHRSDLCIVVNFIRSVMRSLRAFRYTQAPSYHHRKFTMGSLIPRGKNLAFPFRQRFPSTLRNTQYVICPWVPSGVPPTVPLSVSSPIASWVH